MVRYADPPAFVKDTVFITGNHVFHPCLQKHFNDGRACRPRPVEHNFDVLHILPHYLQGIHQSRRHHNGRAVLVVMEYGDVQLFFQPAFDFKTFWRCNVLQVNPAKYRRNLFYRLNDLFRIFGIQANGERIYPRKLLKQNCLAFHHRDRCLCPNIPQAKHRRAVGHHPYQVALRRILIHVLFILCNLLARLCHPRRISGA